MQGDKISICKRNSIGDHRVITAEGGQRQRGISLIETCIAVCILAIIASVAAPSFQGLQEHRRLEGFAIALVTDIHFVRSEAVARNKGMRISFGTDAGGSCYVLHTGNPGNCNCTSDGSAQCTDPNNSTIKSVGLSNDQGVRLQSNVTSMLFDPIRGTTTPTGSIDFIANSGKSIRQIVNITGRTRTCSPLGTMNGYKRC